MSASKLVALVAVLHPLWGLGCSSPKHQATGTGGLETITGSGGSSSSGSTSGGSSGGNAGSSSGTGGSLDGGCHHPGQVAELGACVLSADCKCPLMCIPDPQGELLCQLLCTADADCGPNATCDAGACQLGPVCDPVVGASEFQPCKQIADCVCPFGCFDDVQLGKVCERPCMTENACLDAGQFCESDAGSCQLATSACNPGVTGKGEVQSCAKVSDCSCPLGCFDDPLRGKVCELPCRSEADCADAGGHCDMDAGSCVLQCDPTGASELEPCAKSMECACPLTCIFNSNVPGFCSACDGGDCPAPKGSCVDAGREAAASQSGFPLLITQQGLTACTGNQDCDCPNQCLPLPVSGGLTFVCQPPLPACSSMTDCSDPTTTCLFGTCVPNLCNPYAGVALGDPCDPVNALEGSLDAGGGACLPDSHGSQLLICTAGGDGGAGCSVSPNRAHPETMCPAGSICVAGDAGSFCAAACSFDSACDGGSCALLDPAVAQQCYGCLPVAACLPEEQGCSPDLPTYVPQGGPFDASSVGTEYAPCEGANCACPLACNPDPVLDVVSGNDLDGFCERACQSNADCPLALTACLNQFCTFDPADCGGDAGLGLGGVCDAGDGLGTCVYFSPFVQQNWFENETKATPPAAVCRLNGSSLGSCSPFATRGSSELCGAGTDCLPLTDGGLGCQPLCDPGSDSGGCAAELVCVPVTFNLDAIDEGTCLAMGDGGCALGLADDEFEACLSNADCACGLECLKTRSGDALQCQRPCSVPADCPLDEVCYGEAGKRSCQLNLCLGEGGTCDADLGSDGTCLLEPAIAIPPDSIPRAPPETLGLWGPCIQAGTATGPCDPSADRSRPDLLCVPGAICDQSGPTPTCTWLCTVSYLDQQPSPCPNGQYCVPLSVYQSLSAVSFVPSNQRSSFDLEGSCLPALGADAGP